MFRGSSQVGMGIATEVAKAVCIIFATTGKRGTDRAYGSMVLCDDNDEADRRSGSEYRCR